MELYLHKNQIKLSVSIRTVFEPQIVFNMVANIITYIFQQTKMVYYVRIKMTTDLQLTKQKSLRKVYLYINRES